ncbi:MAG: DUF2892 domain-containing protein [Ignavibacteriales bacterium]|nr:DUF2892 domain-containing protein [Ignavibacteriales bacterium]
MGFVFNSWLGVIGIVPIITGLLNYCPVYSLLGVSTKAKVETRKIEN